MLAAEARDQLADELRRFQRLDARAGTLLGFAGLFVVLAPARSGVGIGAARIAAVLSAVSALMTFLGRDYPTLDFLRFRRRYIYAEPVTTQLRLLDTHGEMLEEARQLTDRKAAWLKVATSALLAAISLAAVGLLVQSS